MTEQNIQRFEKLYNESDGTSSLLEILQDNFSFKEVFDRDPEPMTGEWAACFGFQKLDGPTGQTFKLKYIQDL